MDSPLSFLAHDSDRLTLYDEGPQKFGSVSHKFGSVKANVKFLSYSKYGKLLAWISNGEVVIVETSSWNRIGSLNHPKAQELCFSPQGTYLAVFDTYARNIGEKPAPNLSVYHVQQKRLVYAYLHQTQFQWQPQWTLDETLVARQQTSEVHFFDAENLETPVSKKILAKVRSFSLSPSKNNHYVLFFVPCLKGSPAYVHLYKYPEFKDASKALANKSFYKVETIEFFWNPQSTAILFLTTAPIDKSGASYYGDQMLFYLSARGDSNRVTFDKEGSIRNVCWCPNGKEFIAVYGVAPAKATLFNFKCDPIRSFGEAARNLVMVNPQGNVALIGASGNISSRLEFWNLTEHKLINQFECPDITHMEWSPCGKYLLTSTCSPRLRVNNGFRIFHYTSSLVHKHEYPQGGELFAVHWTPNPELNKPFEVSDEPIKGIDFQIKAASMKKYIPPSQRAAAAKGGLLDDTTKFLSQRVQPGLTPEIDPKIAAKRERRKQKKEEERKKKEEERGDWRKPRTEEKLQKEKPTLSDEQIAQKSKANRKKAIKKKLDSIAQLKADRDSGKMLLKGQEEKISKGAELLQELQQLQLS